MHLNSKEMGELVDGTLFLLLVMMVEGLLVWGFIACIKAVVSIAWSKMV